MPVIRELLTKWKLDTKQANAAMASFDKGIANLKSGILAVGAVGATAAVGLFGIAKSVAKAGDEARKTAMSIGVTTEAYQELGFVAQIGGMQQGDMTTALMKLSRTASDAERGMETYKRAYDDLGISVTDTGGDLKASDEIMMEVADRFAEMEDGTKKTALAMELFGRSGAKLIPTLNQGSAAIGKLREEARASGAVMSDEAGRSAEEFNDTILRLQYQLKGLKTMIGVELIPAITDIVKGWISWMKANKEVIKTKLRAFIRGVVDFLKSLLFVGTKVYNLVSGLAQVFGGLDKVLKIVAIGLAVFYSAKIIMGIGQITSGVFGVIKVMKTLKISILLTQASALAIPLLIGAAVIALGLIIEDIIAFFQGRDSLTGVIVEAFEKRFPAAFSVVKAIFLAIGDLVMRTIDGFKQLIFYFTHMGDIAKVIFGKVAGFFGKIGKYLGLGKIEAPEIETPEVPEAKAGAIPVEAPMPLKGAAEAMTQVQAMTPVTAPVPGAVTKTFSPNVNAPVTVNVPPGTPPENVGEAVKKGIDDALSRVLRETHRATAPMEAY